MKPRKEDSVPTVSANLAVQRFLDAFQPSKQGPFPGGADADPGDAVLFALLDDPKSFVALKRATHLSFGGFQRCPARA